ncbi:MAG TPA: hypothetical protein VM681_03355 [Candidatus Thermoplasmatota archaeon]|nr:hypothetical protein [Candidatus Thermoplasmatota archaeon]
MPKSRVQGQEDPCPFCGHARTVPSLRGVLCLGCYRKYDPTTRLPLPDPLDVVEPKPRPAPLAAVAFETVVLDWSDTSAPEAPFELRRFLRERIRRCAELRLQERAARACGAGAAVSDR